MAEKAIRETVIFYNISLHRVMLINKPDNGLGRNQFPWFGFLVGQFDWGENGLSKLVGWFGLSYYLD